MEELAWHKKIIQIKQTPDKYCDYKRKFRFQYRKTYKMKR